LQRSRQTCPAVVGRFPAGSASHKRRRRSQSSDSCKKELHNQAGDRNPGQHENDGVGVMHNAGADLEQFELQTDRRPSAIASPRQTTLQKLWSGRRLLSSAPPRPSVGLGRERLPGDVPAWARLCVRATALPNVSAPCAWNTFFARSSPTVIISDMTILPRGSSRTHLGTLTPSGGGGHIIKATPTDTNHDQWLVS